MVHSLTWQERHELRSPRPQLAPPPPHQQLHCLQATPVVRCAESRCQCSSGAAVGVTTLHPTGTFMKAGSAVPLASAAQARAIHQLLYGHAVSLRLCKPVTPSSCQIVLILHVKTTSCQHKLVTTHQLSVECPCTPSQTHSCPKKPH